MQDKNVNISIFDVPQNPGFMEPHVVKYTHAYFPVQYFDEVDEGSLADGYIFGRKGKTYIALIGSGALLFEDFDLSDAKQVKNAERINPDLKQKYDLTLKEGRYQSWITELSSESEDGSFDAFKQRILENEVLFQGTTIEYKTRGSAIQSEYKIQFTIDSVPIDTKYSRYENDYVPGSITLRKSESIEFSFKDHSLLLNYYKNIRDVD
jgi:hypothetical protein